MTDLIGYYYPFIFIIIVFSLQSISCEGYLRFTSALIVLWLILCVIACSFSSQLADFEFSKIFSEWFNRSLRYVSFQFKKLSISASAVFFTRLDYICIEGGYKIRDDNKEIHGHLKDLFSHDFYNHKTTQFVQILIIYKGDFTL